EVDRVDERRDRGALAAESESARDEALGQTFPAGHAHGEGTDDDRAEEEVPDGHQHHRPADQERLLRAEREEEHGGGVAQQYQADRGDRPSAVRRDAFDRITLDLLVERGFRTFERRQDRHSSVLLEVGETAAIPPRTAHGWPARHLGSIGSFMSAPNPVTSSRSTLVASAAQAAENSAKTVGSVVSGTESRHRRSSSAKRSRTTPARSSNAPARGSFTTSSRCCHCHHTESGE